jgi:hypothetical protein
VNSSRAIIHPSFELFRCGSRSTVAAAQIPDRRGFRTIDSD